MDVIKEVLNELLKVALLAVIPVLLGYLGKLVEAGFHWLESKTASQWLVALEIEAETIVLAIWQVSVQSAKEKLADGKINADEWKAIASLAKSEAEKQLNAWVNRIPEKIGKMVTPERVGASIEAAIARIRAVRSSGNPTPNPDSPSK
jgi:hypothetical protein